MIKELTYPQGEMFKMKSEYKVPFPLFVGGYGCGKSEILVNNAIRDILEFPGCKVGIYAPTLDLLSLNVIPRLELELTLMGIKFKMNKLAKIMYLPGGRQFIFRSMDNPARIVAYEVYCSHVDEADLMTTAQKGDLVWNRIIARNRQIRPGAFGKKHPDHFNMVSAYTTPEGFKFTYQRWKKAPGDGYKYIAAPTSSNWTLDESFIKNLMDTYTPEQCKAYLMGIWTNIFTGSVYSYFDRERHNTDRVLLPNEPISCSCDFNYGGSCVSVYVPKTKQLVDHKGRLLLKRGKPQTEEIGLDLVEEFVSHDTEQMVITLQDDYAGRAITMFPDATGNKGNSNASISDIAMLKGAGFNIKARSINPRIPDRINAVQRMLYQDTFGVNVNNCPKSVEAMEEHAYSDTTGLPDKFAGPATTDDRNDAMGYCPAFKFPIKKTTTKLMEI